MTDRYGGRHGWLTYSGHGDLKDALEGLSQEMGEKAGDMAARSAANLLRDAIREKTPLGPGKPKRRKTKSGEVREYDYGHGRDNIKVRAQSRRVRATFKANGVFQFTVTAGNAFWLRFRELGTIHQSAKPFFRPAWDGNADRAVEKMGEVLKKAIARFEKAK
ncbi:MAG: hypothetical protein RIS94_3277 [Pseudomonadota bacterium]|jgi:HK97 gp10 family phage protein